MKPRIMPVAIKVFLGCVMFVSAVGSVSGAENASGKNPLIYPGSVLKKANEHYVSYEVEATKVNSYYEKNLKQLGWVKTKDLGPEDATDCGGDWGGTYEKDGLRFKLHVCGFDGMLSNKDIFFQFYNVKPEQVLGEGFSVGKSD